MIALVLAPLVLQGAVMTVDEFAFHHRRGLPAWERIGHPLDTLTVLLAYLWLWAYPTPAPASVSPALPGFIAIAGFSCLFVTKDEWVHHRFCSAAEQWLHALLFILHPLCLLAAGLLWWQSGFGPIHEVQLGLLAVFFVYQTLYWNLPWKSRNPSPHAS
jgi:hypothetical protein